ncbi:uncharacterized protein LOC110975213 [Acanthaster planci]|uniref:Uncharacterized protein LOC110975213 n=1 Tax=Acanthaster planci TaxID=133434 RepID=A0A8B7XSJ3_ACAPL|nr:uncharacterized protein LOC110975213 [Acanthaster planci]XP_022083173.1 uncharacterized protein LOC110975213 [Acanthaster planci]XP_022083174.1 uncharacterized protein LOC110975213 [Acanthaster planci]
MLVKMPTANGELFVIGVDVGGTNTDAVCLQGSRVVATSKVPTTENVTDGLREALCNVLSESRQILGQDVPVSRINIGTTHFVNAVIQRTDLTPVAVIRLCGTASHMMEPFIDFPLDLKQIVCASIHLVSGGYQYNGEEITPLDERELIGCIQDIRAKGISNVVVSGIFSPVNPAQELKVAELFAVHYPSAGVTLSHQVGQLSLLERENASVLNECLKPLCSRTVATFAQTLADLGLACPFFLTQNDGTVISSEQALKFPVHTFSSGPTNSMRGAASLSGVRDGIVIDIGGTSSDVGFLQGGFPKEASTKVKVGGVSTNFQMPDVVCKGLGGGSRIQFSLESGQITSLTIGPDSVGYLLNREAKIFGGQTLTTSDIAVAAGMASFGNPALVTDLPEDLVKKAVDKIHGTLEDVIDQVKLSATDVPVVIVGGGSIFVDEKRSLKGTSKVIKPPHYQVANAIGAALSQVSGLRDTVVSLDQMTREEALEEAKQQAKQAAIEHGAQPDSVQITEVTVTPLAYVTNNATRIKVKAVGDLSMREPITVAAYDAPPVTSAVGKAVVAAPRGDAPGQATANIPAPVPSAALPDPQVDPVTGEWILSAFDVECIAIGAGILGCGGGGDPHLGLLSALKMLREGKKIRIISPERLGSTPELTGLVAPVAFMGAPGIAIEKLKVGREFTQAVECIQQLVQAGYGDRVPDSIEGVPVKGDSGVVYIDDFPKVGSSSASLAPPAGSKVVALMSAEIGGTNGIEPLVVGAMLNLPVVDCDGMGRAFPELQMIAHSIYGHPLCPSVLVDDKGRRAVTFKAESNKHLEDHFRAVVAEMGCQGVLAIAPLSPDTVKKYTIHHSVSRACKLGRAVMQAKKSSPIDVILEHENGICLITGKICDVARGITGGFTRGRLLVEGTGQSTGQQLEVEFQNENLVARSVGKDHSKVLATTPDLIAIVDADLGHPISTEELRYGLRVAVLVLASPPLLRSQKALDVVGPRAFGYDLEFTPVAEYVLHTPIL